MGISSLRNFVRAISGVTMIAVGALSHLLPRMRNLPRDDKLICSLSCLLSFFASSIRRAFPESTEEVDRIVLPSSTIPFLVPILEWFDFVTPYLSLEVSLCS